MTAMHGKNLVLLDEVELNIKLTERYPILWIPVQTVRFFDKYRADTSLDAFGRTVL